MTPPEEALATHIAPAARKSGGRAGRHALRQAGTKGKVVRAGMDGGRYRPLSDHDMEQIHHAALDVLERIGIGDPTEELLAYALPAGCKLNDQGRLTFPRALVEDLIAVAKKEYVLYGVDSKHDIEIKGQRVSFASSGEAVTILDYETQKYRPSLLTDLYDAARLVDQLEHVHNFGQPFIASEYSEDQYTHDMNIAFTALAGTQKPFGLGVAIVDHIDPLISMFDTFLGKEGAFIERPFCTFGGCPIISPLRFGHENLEVMMKMAKLGLTGDVAIAAQAGATAPAALAGALVQTFAETLACLCIMNIIRPGSAMNFGIWPFISDLRTGSFSGGSGEEGLIIAAAAQLCNFYGLISSVPSGMTDSKTVDAQYGYEKAITTTAVALAGGNIISPYPGIVGSLLGQSFEGLLIDNDMMGSILRLVRGIEVNEETLSIDIIENTVYGAGHFLNQDQTLNIMETEYIYPQVADRRTAGEWEVTGKQDIYELAHTRVKKMLSTHYPEYINPEAEEKIRANFPIKLAPADMKPGNGRWE
jgi:trimethylamine--corrinoid protein Co-methyltransferase